MALFIGIDLGTSGCRAMAIDEAGSVQGQAVVSLPAPHREGSAVEQHPTLWWNAVKDCLAQLTTSIDAVAVQAIAVDGTSGTLLLADENGDPLGPALMYNDARASEQAQHIKQVAPANTAAQGASCALAKLLWFYENGFFDSGLFKHAQQATASACYALHQADWIVGQLSGQWGISDANNVMKLGFDAQQDCWPQWLLDLLNQQHIPSQLLPKVVAPGTSIGTLRPELAQQFGLPTTTRIVAGTTDSTASFIATGANKVGEAVTALGSTLVTKVITPQAIFAPEYGVYSQPLFIDGKQYWLAGGGSNSGGAVLRQFFSDEQMQAMTPELHSEQPTGLDYYPLPSIGERFPINDATFKPRMEPRPDNDVQFFQALLEGIAHIESQAYHLLNKLGTPYPVSIRTTGGGAKNPAWTQIRKNVMNTEMKTALNTEAAYGTALLAKHGYTKATQ